MLRFFQQPERSGRVDQMQVAHSKYQAKNGLPPLKSEEMRKGEKEK
jgi:hypothetical protein